jgi:hypothetical protein
LGGDEKGRKRKDSVGKRRRHRFVAAEMRVSKMLRIYIHSARVFDDARYGNRAYEITRAGLHRKRGRAEQQDRQYKDENAHDEPPGTQRLKSVERGRVLQA